MICSFLVGFNPKALENCGPALLQRGVHSFDRLNLWAQSSKIAREKLMNQRLYSYLERYDILYSLQFGFREKCSTSHALVSITEQIRRSIDNNEYGCGVFIDLKKAFDIVNHSILFDRKQYVTAREYDVRERIPHTWVCSRPYYLKSIFRAGGYF